MTPTWNPTNPTSKLWLAAIASTLTILISIVPLGFGLMFSDALREHPIILFMTYASPILAVSSYIAFQFKPNKSTALLTLFSVLFVVATWCLWLSDHANGIIH